MSKEIMKQRTCSSTNSSVLNTSLFCLAAAWNTQQEIISKDCNQN